MGANHTVRYIPARISRRQLLQALRSELQVLCGIARGRPTLAMNALDEIPDTLLATVIPVRNLAVALVVADGQLCGHERAGGPPRPIWAWDETAALACVLLDEGLPLSAAGDELAQHCGWDTTNGRAYIIGLFRSLTRVLAYVPATLPAEG